MTKKCLICDAEAEYKIKNTSDFYCENCAQENFADINLLVKVEEEAQQLKEYLTEKMDSPEEELSDSDDVEKDNEKSAEKNQEN